MPRYVVTVERGGRAPLHASVTVDAVRPAEARALAVTRAERHHGGRFTPIEVRPAPIIGVPDAVITV